MTETEKSIARLTRGTAVGFRTKSGLVRPLGYVRALPAALRAKVQAATKKAKS